MTQQINFDFTQPAERNPSYFYPLSLRLDTEEKANFINGALIPYKDKMAGSGKPLSNAGNADKSFPKSIAQINKLIRPIGLKTRVMTLFLSDGNQTSWAIHSDGVRDANGNPTILEARLSYYEIAESPGAIRWWDDLPGDLRAYAADGYSQDRISCMADCAEALKDNKITWDDIPQPSFSVVTSAPSAILRTNRKHHVIQGPGVRVTVSSQLTFLDGNPVGVWEHIEKNIHLIE